MPLKRDTQANGANGKIYETQVTENANNHPPTMPLFYPIIFLRQSQMLAEQNTLRIDTFYQGNNVLVTVGIWYVTAGDMVASTAALLAACCSPVRNHAPLMRERLGALLKTGRSGGVDVPRERRLSNQCSATQAQARVQYSTDEASCKCKLSLAVTRPLIRFALGRNPGLKVQWGGPGD
jgi:hypothetical protein